MNTLNLGSNAANNITFCIADDWIVKFLHDGQVVVNEKYETDEAARLFWECVRKLAPDFFRHDETPSEFERLCGKENSHV